MQNGNDVSTELTMRVRYNCGCGFTAVADNIGNSPEAAAALEHATKNKHSLTVTGEIRVEREFPRVRSAYQPSQGVA